MVKQSFLREFMILLRREKKWWMIPLGIVLIVLLGLLLFSGSSSDGPFLYPVF